MATYLLCSVASTPLVRDEPFAQNVSLVNTYCTENGDKVYFDDVKNNKSRSGRVRVIIKCRELIHEFGIDKLEGLWPLSTRPLLM